MGGGLVFELIKDLWRQVRQQIRRLLESPTGELSRWGRLAVYQVRLWRFCARQLRRDRLLTVAGDLTFKTLLSVIPLLVIFLLVLKLFFAGDARTGREALDALFHWLHVDEIRVVSEGQEVDLATRIDTLVREVRQRATAGAVLGVLILFYLAMNVLGTTEAAVNRIWRTAERRSYWRKLTMFWLLLTMGPAAIGLAVYVGQAIASRAGPITPGWDWLEASGRWVINLAAAWFVLFLVYKLMPHLHVRNRAAITGAVVAGTVWHVMGKYLFSLYVANAVGVRQLYGTLAVVPISMLWVWLTWVLVLFGCELAYVVQNFRDFARAEEDQAERARSRFLATDFVALQAAAVVGRRFARGQGPTPLAVLAEATGVSRINLQELLGRLEEAGLVMQTAPHGEGEDRAAWLPGRDPATIRLADVLASVHTYLPMPVDAEHLPLYRRVRARYEALRQGSPEVERATSLADLVADEGDENADAEHAEGEAAPGPTSEEGQPNH